MMGGLLPGTPRSWTDLPGWYVDRYDEDGDTIWLPVFHKDWVFDGKSVSTMREVVGERSRGKARAFAASEWGEPFTHIRARKVWMRQRPATFDEECEYSPRLDFSEECQKGAEDALPYWRLDWTPRRSYPSRGGSSSHSEPLQPEAAPKS